MRFNQFSVFAALCAALLLPESVTAQSAVETTTNTTETTTTTTTVVTKRTEQVEKQKWAPLRIGVLDFSTIDIKGQKKFLDHANREIKIPPQSTLNDADRKSINSVMQGFVRMIDAWDNTRTGSANREAQIQNNDRAYADARRLFETVVHGESRPAVIGAEYLSAYLGRHNDVFFTVEPDRIYSAMERLSREEDFPKDFMQKLAKETGATHLIYGTVSDLRSQERSFKGYGIETKTLNYQLDVIVKVVDLTRQGTVYSNVYTGNYREQRPISGSMFDNNIFQNLMTSALEQAADDLYDAAKPGRKNKIPPAAAPLVRLTVNVSGGMLFKGEKAEVFLDGVLLGNGNATFEVSSGEHSIEVKAAGYQAKSFKVDLSGDRTLNVTLEKK